MVGPGKSMADVFKDFNEARVNLGRAILSGLKEDFKRLVSFIRGDDPIEVAQEVNDVVEMDREETLIRLKEGRL